MRVLGIDPGMAIVGYAFLDIEDESINLLSSGSIRTDKTKTSQQRLLEIHEDLSSLIDSFKPHIASVEKIFYFKNAKTIIPVSEARGVIMMTLEMKGIKTFEFTPLEVKQTITGYGRAKKDEVKDMVRISLHPQQLPKLDDTVDAIALALTYDRQRY